MTIVCAQGVTPDQAPDCTPTCSRWGFVNEGRPIKVYHDKANYSPSVYQNMNRADPDFYLLQAVDAWNDVYSCGTLLEVTDNNDEAEVRVLYNNTDDVGTFASATCRCSREGEPCFDNALHEDFYVSPDEKEPTDGKALQQRLRIYQLAGRFGGDSIREQEWIGVYTHELGHNLGLQHIANSVGQSIMNSSGLYRRDEPFQLWPLDIEAIEMRYPCNCTLTRKNELPPAPGILEYQSAELCPVCAVDRS